MKKKYIVIIETDSGYVDCIGICDTAKEAYGMAYLYLIEDIEDASYRVTIPNETEGGNGWIIHLENAKCESPAWATILFYDGTEDTE